MLTSDDLYLCQQISKTSLNYTMVEVYRTRARKVWSKIGDAAILGSRRDEYYYRALHERTVGMANQIHKLIDLNFYNFYIGP